MKTCLHTFFLVGFSFIFLGCETKSTLDTEEATLNRKIALAEKTAALQKIEEHNLKNREDFQKRLDEFEAKRGHLSRGLGLGKILGTDRDKKEESPEDIAQREAIKKIKNEGELQIKKLKAQKEDILRRMSDEVSNLAHRLQRTSSLSYRNFLIDQIRRNQAEADIIKAEYDKKIKDTQADIEANIARVKAGLEPLPLEDRILPPPPLPVPQPPPPPKIVPRYDVIWGSEKPSPDTGEYPKRAPKLSRQRTPEPFSVVW